MRRMVGAALLIVGLGSISVRSWWATRALDSLPIIEASLETSALRHADSIAVGLPKPLAPITSLPDPLVFLSSAPPESLELLPGVGPVLATRLVTARRENGPFRSWDDVDRVRGIGPKTIERLQALNSHR